MLEAIAEVFLLLLSIFMMGAYMFLVTALFIAGCKNNKK